MARILVHRAHHLIHAKAKAAAEELARDLESKFGLCFAWAGDHIEFNRPGVTGRLLVGRDEIELDVELGWLLAGFRRSIEQEIHRQLDAVLEPREGRSGKSAAKGKASPRSRKT
jgi:putative polyhydroxyalkanoate system protein